MTTIHVKWKGEDHTFEPPRGTLHDDIVARFSIPRDRLKVVCRGRQFAPAESADLVAHCLATGSTVMVVGTTAAAQLDSPAHRLRDARKWLVGTGRLLPGMAFGYAHAAVMFVVLFVKSMFVPVARTPSQRPHEDHDD